MKHTTIMTHLWAIVSALVGVILTSIIVLAFGITSVATGAATLITALVASIDLFVVVYLALTRGVSHG